MEESSALLSRRRRSSSSGSGSDSRWSDDSTSSYYSDSDSYVPEWDSRIQDDGELVYIVCKTEMPQADSVGILTKSEGNNQLLERGGFTRQSVRRSSKGLWLKILKRRNSARVKNNLHQRKHQNVQSNDNKVTFSEDQDGELKEVALEVDFTNKIRFGPKINHLEVYFGITTSTFGDGKRLMVSGILPDSIAANEKQIKIGDWLKEIDNKMVNDDNIEQILNNYSGLRIIKVILQRVAGTEVKSEDVKSNNLLRSDLIRHLTDDLNEHELVLNQVLRDLPVSVIYLATEGLTECAPENEGVLYCYPRPEKHNFLCSARGTFITLNHLIPEVLKNTLPTSCTLIVKDCLVNVIYTCKNTELLLLALPDKKCNLFELSLINSELVSVLEFCFKSLNECFTNVANVAKLDHLFSRFFSQILTCGYGWYNQKSTRIENIVNSCDLPVDPLFEQCLPIVQTVHLPWEARLQIDDALTELDATYIPKTHHDVEAQDIFHIVGSCLYYSGHLLTSHLLQVDLMEIHSFLRLHGFLSISCEENLQNLIIWKEVYFDSNKNTNLENETSDSYKLHTPNCRTFLVIVGKGHLLLVAILRGMQTSKNVPPSPYFIEECESTIDLLIEVGLDNFLQRWFYSNLQPQVMLCPEEYLSSGKNKEHAGGFAGFGKKPSPAKRSTDVQSILKKRQPNSDSSNNLTNVESQLNNSNSSQSQSSITGSGQWTKGQQNSTRSSSYLSDDSDSENTSEISEERIQGRRVAREKENRASRNSLSSDSCAEWDGCEATSQLSGSYEFADLSQSLLQKIGISLPTKATAGEENVCFHFLRLENELGILLAPTVNVQKQSDSELYKHVLTNFRKASQKIHTLLQNTLRFKRMLSPSSSVNKSLVAIKEHGILFEVPVKLVSKIVQTKKNDESFSYWVIGRLFEHPKFTEVYVCCHESVPQNMVEVAFRLAFVT